jgi:hypothetical protein
MRLNKVQKTILLTWISAGLKTDEINTLAAQLQQPFKVKRQMVDQYRKKLGVNFQKIKAADEADSLKTGLSARARRVEKLTALAENMSAELLDGDKLWLERVESIGQGDNFEVIEKREFNIDEVQAFRGVLSDIASEMGDRRPGKNLTLCDAGPKPPPIHRPKIKGRPWKD